MRNAEREMKLEAGAELMSMARERVPGELNWALGCGAERTARPVRLCVIVVSERRKAGKGEGV